MWVVRTGAGVTCCAFRSKFNLADLLPLKKAPLEPERLHKHLGLALGFPVAVEVCHEEQGALGFYTRVGSPFWEGFDVKGRTIERCVGFEFSMKLGERTKRQKKCLMGCAAGVGGVSWESNGQRSSVPTALIFSAA